MRDMLVPKFRERPAAKVVFAALLAWSALQVGEGFAQGGAAQSPKVDFSAAVSAPLPSSSLANPTCPPGAKLVKHNGSAKCAWESDLRQVPDALAGALGALKPEVWLCFIIGRVPVFDYYGGFVIIYCINLTELFEPCGTCADGMRCQASNGKAECGYQCGADEVGGGRQPCRACGEGEVPNAGGTACEACERGESSTPGECNRDPCEGVSCPQNGRCVGGECRCNHGYRMTRRVIGRFADPDVVRECVRDPCAGVVCGAKSACLNGACRCLDGYEDPDGDGNCAKPCTQKAYDAAAKASLLTIPKEPWEQGESYDCVNGVVTVQSPRISNGSRYLYKDYPTNSVENSEKGDVCILNLKTGVGGGGHSHPHFVWERDEGVQCGPKSKHKIMSEMQVNDLNKAGVNFSPTDAYWAMGNRRPLYLVVPQRNCVKVYRENNYGRWWQSGCLK
ncbi:MAG: hypothetical protein OXF72_03085 [Gammaproteobacteria bacterium]|nr:hypothetical protein [Gammaproteobacteria bacterium]MCY4322414.1 hypothetical protein [Gammaproteobacteria bacterium]